MKRIVSGLICVVLFGALSTTSANLLQWGSEDYEITDVDGSDLPYSTTEGTNGAFAQLIFAGANGTGDIFATNQLDTTGVSGDDVVVDVTFSFGGPTLGSKVNHFKLINSSVDSTNENGAYYVRVYNAANLAFDADGTAAALEDLDVADVNDLYYWQSDLHTFTYSELGANDQWDFSGGSDRQTTFAVVPEPATALIFGPGSMLLIALRRLMLRRRRSSNASELEEYAAQMEPAYATAPVERTLSWDCPHCGSKEHGCAPPTWWMHMFPYASRHQCHRCWKEYVSLDW